MKVASIKAIALTLVLSSFFIQLSCSKSTPKLSIGKNYKGGVIIYLLQDGDKGYEANVQHGLIVSTVDLGYAEWGCKGVNLTGADSKLIGDGAKNSDEILAGCSTAGIAAKLCSDYSITVSGVVYDDWYLPSMSELEKIYENKDAITTNPTPYCSSTEAGMNYAWSTSFFTGLTNTSLKDDIYTVRAVRSF